MLAMRSAACPTLRRRLVVAIIQGTDVELLDSPLHAGDHFVAAVARANRARDDRDVDVDVGESLGSETQKTQFPT